MICSILKKTHFYTEGEYYDDEWHEQPGFQFLGFVTIHSSISEVTAFEIQSLHVYQYNEIEMETHIFFQHTIAEFSNSTMSTRLIQLFQLIQCHRSDFPSSATISFGISEDLVTSIKAYEAMGMTSHVSDDEQATRMFTHNILVMVKYSTRAAYAKYNLVILWFYPFNISNHCPYFDMMQTVLGEFLAQWSSHSFYNCDTLEKELHQGVSEWVNNDTDSLPFRKANDC